MRPVLVDLFCGAGGSAVGYHRAGFDVVGVDHRPQSRYPFTFIQADALEWLRDAGLSPYSAIHASPPCQAYSVSTAAARAAGKLYPDLLEPTRTALVETGLPWVIENVPGAPLRADFRLCGCMFALPGLKRERWFETSWRHYDLRSPCHHPDPIVTVIGHGPNQHSPFRYVVGSEWSRLKQQAMGIDWMNRDELGEAIPPAYTEHVGAFLLAEVRERVS
jgi:DNA (cytosine-5)-methyltransferase 1